VKEVGIPKVRQSRERLDENLNLGMAMLIHLTRPVPTSHPLFEAASFGVVLSSA
jgi:hypothetical protein